MARDPHVVIYEVQTLNVGFTNMSLNYHHLHQFWTVAREGSLVRAAEVLRLSHPTISQQLKQLEDALGTPLFDRRRRRLELTDAGRLAQRYADEIFTLGREFLEVMAGQAPGRRMSLNVGVSDALPKLVAKSLLQPALDLEMPVLLRCVEDGPPHLLASLALHELDVVLSDAPVPPGTSIRAFNHPLGACGVSFLAAPRLARRLRRGFPASLDGAPFLWPASGTSLHRNLDGWFTQRGVRPDGVAEFADSALLKVFAADGLGAFCAPTVVETDVVERYGVEVVGRTVEIREQFFALSVERRVRHPAVAAICEAARSELFTGFD
jgi:LysR family transcriptional activator of nhaA